MDLYSPKSNDPNNFRKNTMRENVPETHKKGLTGTTIVFEMANDNRRNNYPKENKKPDVSLIDHLRQKFYERMKLFFDSEEKNMSVVNKETSFVRNNNT